MCIISPFINPLKGESMKKLFVPFLLAMLIATPSLAKDVSSSAQLMVNAPWDFANSGDTDKTLAISGHAEGAFMINSNGCKMFFAYLGPHFKINELDLWLMTGTFLEGDGGLSPMASLRFNVNGGGWASWLNWFTEYDYTFPVETDGKNSHTDNYAYLYTQLTANIGKQTALGLAIEQFWVGDDRVESAIGPKVSHGKISFWPAWDFAPDSDAQLFVFRLSISQ